MKILFVGGTGVISAACSELCLNKGYELFLLNRGKTKFSTLKGAKHLKADINDVDNVKSLIKEIHFDAVVDWIAFTEEDVKRDFEIFKDKTNQYVFISSASAYAKPPALPLTETFPLSNPYWKYSENKIHCENFLFNVHKKYDFPITIVRPSHTYNPTKIPLQGGFTALNRLINGQEIIVHGDGTSLWTLTHHKDFADGFIGILGNAKTIGEAYNITGDEVLTWDEIAKLMAEAAGVEARIKHVPSDVIVKFDKEWGDGLLGDKAYSLVFDNSKIKLLVPDFKTKHFFKEGAKEIIKWYRADTRRQNVNKDLDATMNKILEYFTFV